MMDTASQEYCWSSVAGLDGNPYLLGEAALDGFDCLFIWFSHSGDYSTGYYPLAFAIMASLLRMNGGKAEIAFWDPDQPDTAMLAGRSMVCFFPQVAGLDTLDKAVAACHASHPDVPLTLFNSEQHQHEMMLCTPRAEDIGRMLLERMPGVDYCLIGEAEASFLALCGAIKDGTMGDASGVEGVPQCLYRSRGGIAVTALPQVPVRFEFLPFPARDNLEKSIAASGVNTASVRVQSSRGCTSACQYCAESCANLPQGGRKKAWLGKPLDLFIQEIEILSQRYGAYYFNVNDSSFEDPGTKGITRMREFFQRVIERAIPASFKIHLRVETLGKLSDQDFDLMKRAGVDILIMGVESGLEYELDSYKKRTTARENVENIDRIDRDGRFFNLLGHLMFSPVLRLEDIDEKLHYLRRIGRGWDYLNISNNLIVFYGSAYHRFLGEQGLDASHGVVTPVVPYRYRDDRVAIVARELSGLRTQIPEVMPLQSLLYDACNLIARYSNPANAHLACHAGDMACFGTLVERVKGRLQDVYTSFAAQLVELVRLGEALPSGATIARDVAGLLAELREGERTVLQRLSGSGFGTDRLHLRTWLSKINVSSNTSQGKV